MTQRSYSCLVASTLAVASMATSVSLAESNAAWYRNTRCVQRDSLGVAHNLFATLFSKGYNLKQGNGPVSGCYLYASLSASEVKKLSDADNQIVVRQKHVLTAAEAPTYAKYFGDRAAATTSAPWYVSATGLVPVPAIKALAGAATLVDVLLQLDGAAKAQSTCAMLAAQMAAGGVFRDIAVLVTEGQHLFLVTNIVYSVAVGNEKRNYVLESSRYALKVE